MPRLHSSSAVAALTLALVLAGCASDQGPLAIAASETCNPLASTDQCLFPFPSRFFQRDDPASPSGVRTDYRREALPLPLNAPPVDITLFNDSDGHPPSAPLLVHLGVDVQDAQLVGQRDDARWTEVGAPIALFNLRTGERVPLLTEMDQNSRVARHEGRHALILRPMVPMEMGDRHVAVLTRVLLDVDGVPLETPPGFAALRDVVPTTHAALEAARADYDELFAFLDAHGYARSELLLAWDFQVASEAWVSGGILSMREQALAAAAMPGQLGYTIDNVVDDPNPNVRRIVEGTFEVPNFLTVDNALERRPDGSVVLQTAARSFPFTMIIPARAATGGPLPLLLFGHGVFGTGRDYLTGTIGTDTIQPLAEQIGGVVIATDFVGLSAGDLDLIQTEVAASLDGIHVVTDRLQQAVINNLVLVELVSDAIAGDARVAVAATPLLTSDVHYYGVSLGGIQGASIVSLSPRITRAILAVPGAAWSTLLTRSTVYAPIKAVMDLLYPDPLMHQAYISMLQTRFDGTDGVNTGALFSRRPLMDAPPGRQVLVIEAVGDCLVPNIATGILGRVMGLSQLEPSVETVAGLPPVNGPTTGAVLAQILMPDRLMMYTPPETNVVPAMDNGTHSDALGLPAAVDQTITFLRDGIIEHTCTGPCDPN